MALEKQRLTVAAFWEQHASEMVELINGEVVEMSPSGRQASSIARRIGARLGDFVDENALGDVTTADGGYRLDEDNMRVPDVAYVSNERLAAQDDPTKYVEGPPDLAVEVISPTDTASATQEKIDLYLRTGVRLVWVVYPSVRKVYVYRPGKDVRVLGEKDTLEGGEVLPGFSLPVLDIFPRRR